MKINLQLHEWNALAELPLPRSEEDVRTFFWPKSKDNQASTFSGSRQNGFLANTSDDEYEKLFNFILQDSALAFAKPISLVQAAKLYSKTMKSVMQHVCQWLTKKQTSVPQNSSNKPLLRKELLYALGKGHEDPEFRSIELEEKLLQYAQRNHDKFSNPSIRRYLDEFLTGSPPGDYSKRFQFEVWNGLLVMVRQFAGQHLQHQAMTDYNKKDLAELRGLSSLSHSTSISFIATSICNSIQRIPEVTTTPELMSQNAQDRLHAALTAWVADAYSGPLDCVGERECGNLERREGETEDGNTRQSPEENVTTTSTHNRELKIPSPNHGQSAVNKPIMKQKDANMDNSNPKLLNCGADDMLLTKLPEILGLDQDKLKERQRRQRVGKSNFKQGHKAPVFGDETQGVSSQSLAAETSHKRDEQQAELSDGLSGQPPSSSSIAGRHDRMKLERQRRVQAEETARLAHGHRSKGKRGKDK